MYYTANISFDGKYWDADFPDAPGCHTFADTKEELRDAAQEALEGWLEAHLVDGEAPPKPVINANTLDLSSGQYALFHVPAALASAISIRWARQSRDLSQRQLAELVGVTQQAIAKLESADANPEINTVDRVARALGLNLELSFTPVARIA